MGRWKCKGERKVVEVVGRWKGKRWEKGWKSLNIKKINVKNNYRKIGKKNNLDANVGQLECSNNECYTSTFWYIYRCGLIGV